MMRILPSPETRAASTKSRLRNERVCALSTRELYAQAVMAMMKLTRKMLVPAAGT